MVIMAAELLKKANELIRNKVHPTSIISGFKMAARESVKYIENNLVIRVNELEADGLENCARTSMSSKIIGNQMEFFSQMVVDAI